MINQVNSPEYTKALKKTQKLCDEHFNDLVKDVVDYHDYQKHKVLFDRKSPAADKKGL